MAKMKEEEEMRVKIMEENRKEEEGRRLKELREEKGNALPPEPSMDDSDVVNVMIRFPDGERLNRRFKVTDDIKYLFYYVDSSTIVKNENNESDEFKILPGNYNLVTQFPRRILSEARDCTLKEIGLNNKFEALFIELK